MKKIAILLVTIETHVKTEKWYLRENMKITDFLIKLMYGECLGVKPMIRL